LPNDDHLYSAMSCYWVNEFNQNVIETYLFDFHQDIYGWFIEIIFHDYIRDNIAIKSEDELKELLAQDAQWIKDHQ
jgi:FAD synthase